MLHLLRSLKGPDNNRGTRGESHNRWLTAALVCLCQATESLAGPPLVIDDPGILDPGSWELIAAVSGEKLQSGRILQLPSLDISFGTSANTQVSLFLPRVVVDPDAGSKASGFDFAAASFKWRFASTERWEWAVAPGYAMPVSHELAPRGGPADINLFTLPLLASRTAGDWTWTGQLGWVLTSRGDTAWDYGVAVDHPLAENTLWMVSLSGFTASSLDDGNLNIRVGVDHAFTPAIHLLASAGTGLIAPSDPVAELDYSFYLGLQWFP